MKKFLVAMLSLAVVPMLLVAQSFELKPVSADRPTDANFKVPFMVKADVPSVMKPSTYQPLSAIYKPFKTAAGLNLTDEGWMLAEDTEPIVYEPISGTYIVVGRDVIATEAGQPFYEQTGVIYIMTSNNNGSTWTNATEIFRQQKNFDVNPTLAVTNPTGSANPANFSYFIYSTLYRAVEGQTSAPYYGGHFIFVSPEGSDQISMKGPSINNPSERQQWSTTTAATYTKNNKDYTVLAGMLSPETGYQAGNYGCANINITDLDVNTSIPAAWSVTKFRQPDNPASGSHYNNNIYVDNDENGTVYACVANMFADNIEKRVVGFSKSVDNGQTWSDFTKMSPQILSNYSISQGAHKDSSLIWPYESNSFVVYGVDQLSYFTRVFVNMPHPIPNEIHLVEINYNGASWSIRKIENLSGMRMFQINLQKPNSTSTTEESIPFIDDKSFEISAAKSLDGNVVVKFLNHREDYIRFDQTSIAIRTGNTTDAYEYTVESWDSLLTNDVFISYRNMSSSNWSTPVNVTDDLRYNRNTIMPKVVKDIRNIPILHLRTDEASLKRTSQTSGQPIHPLYYNYPSFLCELINDRNKEYFVEVMVADATITSVNDEVAANNSIAIYPNPVNNVANFNYTLENAGNVVVRISNAMGQTIAEAVNGYMEAGNYNTNFDASRLANGTYYVTMTINGQSVTKVMNIVK